MLDFFSTQAIELASYLTDANKRIFGLYLLSAILFSTFVYRKLPHTDDHKSGFFAYLFNKDIWLHTSAKQDYLMFFINKLIKGLLWGTAVLTMFPVAIGFSDALESVFGHIEPVTTNTTLIIAGFTLLLFLLDDFTRFLLHWLLHKVPFLWDIHKVHHSAEVLTPMTIYRSHPIESYFYACRMALAQGLAVGIGYYFVGPQLKMYDWLGANVFVFLFNIMGSNLRHSHVQWCWPHWIEKWFISPGQHQIHHSIKPVHFDTNLGSALAIWDRLFGTLVLSDPKEKIEFGLGDNLTDHSSVKQLYVQPLIDIKNRVFRKA